MAKRIPWDEQEALLLFDTYEKIEKNPEKKIAIISALSINLRRRAQDNGKTIDDTFRNNAGISMRISEVDKILHPEKTGLTKTSELFRITAVLYSKHRRSFLKKVQEVEEYRVRILADLCRHILAYDRLVDSVITSQIEHHAVLNACAAVSRRGIYVHHLSVEHDGTVLPETLALGMTEKKSLVSIMMVNNEIGTIEPIQELAAVAHSRDALFHTDAVQAVGHIPIDVKELGVDMLSASAHKFNGPKGIGFLYIRKGTKIYPYSDGGAQEFGMRAGTENIAAIVGMAVALKKNCDEITEITENLQRIEAKFIRTLKNAHIDFERNGSERRVPGNISISIRGASGEMLLHRLDLKGIAISTGSACDSVNTQVSHVIRAIGIPAEYAKGTIRVSFGRENTEADATAIAEALIQILAKK